jgi:hypothetical protein
MFAGNPAPALAHFILFASKIIVYNKDYCCVELYFVQEEVNHFKEFALAATVCLRKFAWSAFLLVAGRKGSDPRDKIQVWNAGVALSVMLLGSVSLFFFLMILHNIMWLSLL